ncbi:MAG: hypothetical protein M0R28_18035 [Pigmentiphaga sp.]|nr:hypothetical protein [Pigmentiphaga sp.]
MHIEDANKIPIWTSATVDALIRLREQAVKHGASALKAWTMLGERAALATRRATSVDGWLSTIMDSFRVSNIDNESAQVMIDLSGAVGPDFDEWIAMVDEHLPMLIARAKAKFAEIKKANKAKRAELEDAYTAANELLEAVGEAPKKRAKTAKKTAKKTDKPTDKAQGELL